MLKAGSKVGIMACSNGIAESKKGTVESLKRILAECGLQPVVSSSIYVEDAGNVARTGKERAEALMEFYKRGEIEAIFDISGGDVANEILNFLNYEVIEKNPKPFFGYSDLTTVLLAIHKKTGQPCYLYQIRNLAGFQGSIQRDWFVKSILEGQDSLYRFSYQFLRGNSLEGTVIGGNIRCLLKLAGTPFWPDFSDKILFLEVRGGEVPQMITYLNQLEQIGAFEQVRGVLLGTFTVMEERQCRPTMEKLVLEMTEEREIPIVKTGEIGHGGDSRCLIIGQDYRFCT